MLDWYILFGKNLIWNDMINILNWRGAYVVFVFYVADFLIAITVWRFFHEIYLYFMMYS